MSEDQADRSRWPRLRRGCRCRRSGSPCGRSCTRSAPTTTSCAGTREKRYALTMFPYPSGDLHMGHAEVFALHDVIARYWWQRGLRGAEPDGLRLLRAERRERRDPRQRAPGDVHLRQHRDLDRVLQEVRRQLRLDAHGCNTSDPEYYRWTQWLFLKFRERGLAYRKNSPVNWCPFDQTVLANEQVVDGLCERCGAEVTKRELTQWYFKITDYAQELLDDLDDLARRGPSG